MNNIVIEHLEQGRNIFFTEYRKDENVISMEYTLNNDGSISSNLKDTCPCCGRANCYADCDGSQMSEEDAEAAGFGYEDEDDIESRRDFNSAIDGIEALTLAMACAGVNMDDPRIPSAIFTAVEGAANNV